jgi:dihydroflavonol-4-reductase
MTVVVTGASGHLGTNLVRALLASGAKVRAVDMRRGPGLEGLDLEFVSADVVDHESMQAALAGAEVVYHLAARISIAGDPDGSVWRVNVDGVRVTAAAARAAGVRRFVHCSSLHAFDMTVNGRVDETHPRSVGAAPPLYDRSKWAGEVALRGIASGGLDYVVVNPTGVVGPVDLAPSRMGRTLLAAFKGRMALVIPGGFDWVDVRDVAAGLMAAAERGRTGENYLLGGHRASVQDLVAMAARVAGRRPPRGSVPLKVVGPAAAAAIRIPARYRHRLLLTPESIHAVTTDPDVDTTKARTELGYEPRPLAQTVEDSYADFRDRGLLP